MRLHDAMRSGYSTKFFRYRIFPALLGLSGTTLAVASISAQLPADSAGGFTLGAPAKTDLSLAPSQVTVNPVARDEEIRKRVQSVLEATQWFQHAGVRVQSGIVFLEGVAGTEAEKKWAGDLARNTQDVVAVANRMTVPQPSMWDMGPATNGLRTMSRDFIRSLPFLAVGVLILFISLFGASLAARGMRGFLDKRIAARLLRNVIARASGVIVFLFGVYVILRVLGLTQLALTIVGGTGLIGLAVGIAFRDITENFLASVFLSIQRPFETTDLIEVAGVTGYVQQLNMRTTVLMNLSGNLVQIPNATVYKSNLRNYSTNCNRREDFGIGIGYDDVISEAQEITRKVLAGHPAVLKDPEPLVLVDNLGSSTVNLRIYFWLNGKEHSWLKVRSSVIRLVKREFQKSGISMPDQGREMLFPQGVPVTIMDGNTRTLPKAQPAATDAPVSVPNEAEAVATDAEAGLSSEAGTLEEQARQAKPTKPGENLLQPATSDRSA